MTQAKQTFAAISCIEFRNCGRQSTGFVKQIYFFILCRHHNIIVVAF